jgi:uncharacterized membrane protein YgcG
MSTVRSAFAACVLAILVCVPASAEKTLSWDSLNVRAELDSSGKLRVTERHTIVFDGDWNGGERVFRVGRGQELTVDEVALVDANGTAQPMARGDLSQVGQWDLNGTTLRWRSRLPSDPPFENQRLIYDVRYSLDRILVAGEGANEYILNHDFAFPDRPAPIGVFDLSLSLAPEWSGPADRVLTARVPNLAAGNGYVLRVPLRYTGAGEPSAIPRPTLLERVLRPWLLGVPAVILLALFFRSERQWRSRLEVDHDPIDVAWLERNVFVHRPEVAGMILDGVVGPPEVAALLATMERDGKVRSAVLPGESGKPDLALELLVPLTDLEGREADVAHALFSSQDKIKASELRAAHATAGFDLPAIIRKSVESEAEQVAPSNERVWRWKLALAFFFFAVVSVIVGIGRDATDVGAVFVVVFGGIVVTLLAIGAPRSWRNHPGAYGAIRLMLPGALLWLIAEGCQRLDDDGSFALTFYGVSSIALFLGGFYTILLDLARERLSIRGLQIRSNLLRAQEWFSSELEKESPNVRDEWMPWLIALNLDDRVGKWFEAFGGKRATTVMVTNATPFTGSSYTSGGTSAAAAPEFSAGGGRFGGAGSTGSWAAAATAMAAPMSAVSTSSSSSSSSWSSSSSGSSSSSDSSSSSSGGGGGGGW